MAKGNKKKKSTKSKKNKNNTSNNQNNNKIQIDNGLTQQNDLNLIHQVEAEVDSSLSNEINDIELESSALKCNETNQNNSEFLEKQENIINNDNDNNDIIDEKIISDNSDSVENILSNKTINEVDNLQINDNSLNDNRDIQPNDLTEEENPFDDSNAIQSWDNTADRDVFPSNTFQDSNKDRQELEDDIFTKSSSIDVHSLNNTSDQNISSTNNTPEQNEELHEVTKEKGDVIASEFSNNVQPWDKTADEDIFPNSVQGHRNEPELIAEENKAGTTLTLNTSNEQNILSSDNKSNIADISLQWNNTDEHELMPWEQQNIEVNEPVKNQIEQKGANFSLTTGNMEGEEEEEKEKDLSNTKKETQDFGPTKDVETMETSYPQTISQQDEDHSLLWENNDADDSAFPWNSKNETINKYQVESNDNDMNELKINDNIDNKNLDDEEFLAQLGNENDKSEPENNTFEFLENDESILTDKQPKDSEEDRSEITKSEQHEDENKIETDDKFDFLEEDDDILLEDVMDDNLLDDENADSFDNQTMGNIDEILSNQTPNNTVIISSERRSSKYQPLQITPKPPQKMFSNQPRASFSMPAESPKLQQSFPSQILKSPQHQFTNLNNKLASELQKEKKKSDAYDFPQDLLAKSKPKQVKEVKENIYTQIENSALKPHFQPEVFPPLGIASNSNFDFRKPTPISGYGNRYSRSNSAASSKSISFFAELPTPKNIEKRNNLHLKNPYDEIESQSNIRISSGGSSKSVSNSIILPKKKNVYASSSPLSSQALLNKSLPVTSNKFIPSNLPPQIKKVSNPYAPAAVGGHVRQISSTIINPDDVKPNLIPVPVKSPGLNSPLSPVDPGFAQPTNFASATTQNKNLGKYAPSNNPQSKYAHQSQALQQPLQQQVLSPLQQQMSPSLQQQFLPTFKQPFQQLPHESISQQQLKCPPLSQLPSLQQQSPQTLQSNLSVISHTRAKVPTKSHKSASSINDVYGSTIVANYATSTNPRKSVAPPSLKGRHALPPTMPFTPAPVVINPENLVRRQWPIFSFSAEGTVASLVPKADGYGNNINNIRVLDISLILKKDDFVSSFPGPLIKNKTKRKDLIKWLTDIIASLESSQEVTSTAELLTWKCLKLMTQKIDKPGDFSDNEYIKEICGILNPDLITSDPMSNSFDIVELTRLGKNFVPTKPCNAFALDNNGIHSVHRLLETGDKKAALEFCVAQGDWTMSLLIANLISPMAFNQITKLYTTIHFANDPKGQDLNFFIQSNVEGEFSAEHLKGKESWLVGKFNTIIPFILMGNPNYGKILMQIGEVLTKAGYKSYGKLSYILSGLPLIPQFLCQIPASIYGMIIEEIYAFVLLSSGNIPQNFSIGFPHLIPLEISHAGYLADIGCSVGAKKYCDITQNLIASKQLFCEPATVLAQNNLCERLSQVGSGWLSSRLSRPQLDKVWTTLDKSFNKFVAGEDVPQQNQPTDGVFAKFTGSATLSRTPSTLDISDLKNHIDRRSIGNNNMVSGSRSHNQPQPIQENAMLRDTSNGKIYPFPTSVTPIHSQTKYAPGASLANYSNESLYAIPPQPFSTTKTQHLPEERGNNYHNVSSHSHMKTNQYSPKISNTQPNETSNFTPISKSVTSSPVPVKSNTFFATNDNSLSRSSTKSIKASPLTSYARLNTTPIKSSLPPTRLAPPLPPQSASTTIKSCSASPSNGLPSTSLDYEHATVYKENSKVQLESEIVQSPPPAVSKLENAHSATRMNHVHEFEDYKPKYVVEIDSHEIQKSNNNTLEPTNDKNNTETNIQNEEGDFGNDNPLGESTYVNHNDVTLDKVENSDSKIANIELNEVETMGKNDTGINSLQSFNPTEIRDTDKVTKISKEKSIYGENQISETSIPDSFTVLKEANIGSNDNNTKEEEKQEKREAKEINISSPPIAPAYTSNRSRVSSRTINRYGPPGSASYKKPVNPYASVYAPKQSSKKSAYEPSTEDSKKLEDDNQGNDESGIPDDMSNIDMFSFGGYSIPPPPLPTTASNADEEKNDISNDNNVIEANKSETRETQKEDKNDDKNDDGILTIQSNSTSENSGFVPTYRPPTQSGMNNRNNNNSLPSVNLEINTMFAPLTSTDNNLIKVNSKVEDTLSPIHQITEERRYYAQDTGEYYDDVVDSDDDEDDNGKQKEQEAKLKAEKEELERKKKLKAAEEEAKRKREEEEKNKKKTSKSNNEGRWFGWLGKNKDDKPKPIKAKLGEENSFYYDEKLKRWINKKAPLEEQLEASKPPPPPMMKKATPAVIKKDDDLNTPSPLPSDGLVPPKPINNLRPVKKDSIEDLLSMNNKSGGSKRNTRRGPRRGYVDVMAQNNAN